MTLDEESLWNVLLQVDGHIRMKVLQAIVQLHRTAENPFM